MVDAFSIASAALSVLQVADLAYKFVRQVTDPDVRTDILQARLIAEKATLETSTNQLRLLSQNRSATTRDQEDQVTVLLNRVQDYEQKARSSIGTFQDPPGRRKRAKSRGKTHAADDYDRLKDLLYAIQDINDAMRAIATQPPPYSPFNDELGGAEMQTAWSWHSELSQSEATGTPRSRALDASIGSLADLRVADSQSQCIPMTEVYNTAYQGLLALSGMNQQMAHVAARLKLWAAGLFNESAPFDVVFPRQDSTSQEPNMLRQGVLHIMGLILVVEETELRRILNTNSSLETELQEKAKEEDRNESLSDVCTRITACLGSEELIETAVEASALHFEPRSDDHLDQSDRNDTGLYPSDLEEPAVNLSRTAHDISFLVEQLFDFLPAIRSEQKYYCFVKAAKSKIDAKAGSVPVKNNSGFSALSDGTEDPTQDERARLMTTLLTVGNVVKDHDRLQKDGQVWQPTWQKIQERLEETLPKNDAASPMVHFVSPETRQTKDERTRKELNARFEKWLANYHEAAVVLRQSSIDSNPLQPQLPDAKAKPSKDDYIVPGSIRDLDEILFGRGFGPHEIA